MLLVLTRVSTGLPVHREHLGLAINNEGHSTRFQILNLSPHPAHSFPPQPPGVTAPTSSGSLVGWTEKKIKELKSV